MDFALNADQEALRDRIEKVLRTLTFRERAIVKLRYGLLDGHVRTLEEVGKVFGVTRERVRQIEYRALERLQDPERAGGLAPFAA